MTVEQHGRISGVVEPSASSGTTLIPSPRQAFTPAVLHGQPRSAEAEEAYLRSVKEQAAIDIAAGW